MKLKEIDKGKRFSILITSFFIYAMTSGCINRVSILSRQPTGTPIAASEVKVFPSFKDISGPWRIEGMISSYKLPLMNNTTEKREALVKETAAGLGINALVGLQPNIGEGVRRPAHSNGLLVKTGAAQEGNTETMPKFIVCLPPVNFKIAEPPGTNLDGCLRETIQFFFSYTKGYYVYRCDAPGVSNAGILNGSANSASLSKPLGIVPDYALLCDVEGYDKLGYEDGLTIRADKRLAVTFTLFDMKERRAVWTKSTFGLTSNIPVYSVGVRVGTLSAGPDDMVTSANAVMRAIDTVPVVNGFRGGAISPPDKL